MTTPPPFRPVPPNLPAPYYGPPPPPPLRPGQPWIYPQYRPAPAPVPPSYASGPAPVYIVLPPQKKGMPAFAHIIHIILVLITCGLWLPVYLVHAIISWYINR